MTENKKLQVIGSYFVDLLYNNLYQKAKTDKIEYQDIMVGYISSVKADAKLVRRQVASVHEYYKTFMNQDNLEYREFVHDVCHELTTREMRRKLRPEQEQEFVADAFYKLLASLGHFLTRPENIKNVISEENRKGEVAKIFTEKTREQSVAILMAYRTDISNKFIEKSTGVKTKIKTSGNEVENIKKAFVKVVRMNAELLEKLKRRDRKIEELEAELEDLEAELGEQEPKETGRSEQHSRKPETMHSREDSQRQPGNKQVSKPRVDASFFSDTPEPRQSTKPAPNFSLSSRLETPVEPHTNNSRQPAESTFKLPGDMETNVTDSMVTELPKQTSGDDSLSRLEKMVDQMPTVTS